MQLTQSVRRNAALYGDKIALEFEDRAFTWPEFEDRCARLAGVLRDLGLSNGDRVAMLGFNSHRYIEFYFGSMWAGGVMTPINFRWSVPEIVYALNDCAPEILLVDRAHVDLVKEIQAGVPDLRHVIFADDGSAPDGLLSYEDALGAADRADDAGRGYEELACVFYTGGTTGRSKGVMLSHRNLMFNSLTGMVNLRFNKETAHLHMGPLFHLAGGARIFMTTVAGGRHVVLPGFKADAVMQTIQDKKITHMVMVPTMLNMLMNDPSFGVYDLSSLTDLSYGASPMPEALIRRAIEALPTVRIAQSYGMTELSPVATCLSPEFHELDGPYAGRLKSAGRPIFGVDVQIFDDRDNEVAQGEIGEVVVRGPNVMQGYWNKPELTAEALRNGWMHTGDAGYVDEEGFLFMVDRVKDMIISGGENVFSAEVEDVLMKHADVVECAVIGIPSDKWGEQVHAVVVPREGSKVTAEDLMAHCRDFIAPYKCPRSVDLRGEPLPQSGPGKILKSELRKPFWAGRDRAIV
jgi:long-chain acyl-CoA synthetase